MLVLKGIPGFVMDLVELCVNVVCINLCFLNAEKLMVKQSVPAELYLKGSREKSILLFICKSWWLLPSPGPVCAQPQMVNSGIHMHVNSVICNLYA